jgi:hypothetical protein
MGVALAWPSAVYKLEELDMTRLTETRKWVGKGEVRQAGPGWVRRALQRLLQGLSAAFGR